ARAIDYVNEPVHDLGSGYVAIPHCDIKPANILIVGNTAQVADFCLAPVFGNKPSAGTAGTLTPAYVAPERIENEPCRQTDQYSLGITYFELRTGQLPFVACDPLTAMQAHVTGNLDFSGLTPPEQQVMCRACALAPSQRYPSTVEMVKDLRKATTSAEGPAC